VKNFKVQNPGEASRFPGLSGTGNGNPIFFLRKDQFTRATRESDFEIRCDFIFEFWRETTQDINTKHTKASKQGRMFNNNYKTRPVLIA
jgi:hypothetical protein